MSSEYLVALALTLAIEVPAYLLGLAALHRLGRRRTEPAVRRRLTPAVATGLAIAVNLATHPLLWSIFTSGAAWTAHVLALPLAEIAVAVVEGLLIFAVVRRDMGWLLMLAAAANAASFAVGLIRDMIIRNACCG